MQVSFNLVLESQGSREKGYCALWGKDRNHSAADIKISIAKEIIFCHFGWETFR